MIRVAKRNLYRHCSIDVIWKRGSIRRDRHRGPVPVDL